jgi:LacI family transcriptional regulator
MDVSSKSESLSPVNIKDVATRAGVSAGTVSNVLNRPTAVRPTTRARVEAAIAELGFVPNASARQLVVGQNHTIAYVVLDASNPFFTDVARGIEEVAGAHNLSLFICNSDQSEEREDRFLERLTELRVRGVLITALAYGNSRLAQLRQLGIPVVLVDRAPELAADWCAVGVDDVAGGEMAAAHLLEIGRDQLAFVGGPPSVPQLADRLAGARSAATRAGLGEDSLLVLETSAPTIAQGRRAGERLLGLPKRARPNGVFCANDLLAFGLVQGLLQHGVRVPQEIAAVGYDDIELADAASVPLTSISQPRHALGKTGAELLLEETSDPDHEHRHVLFRPELVARASTIQRGVA